MLRAFSAFLALSLFGGTSGCAEWSEEDIGRSEEALLNAEGFESERDAIGQISGRCTGTLIAPQVVLTAAHCFDDEDGKLIDFAVFRPSRGAEVSRREHGAAEIVVHPKYRDLENYDLAIVHLGDPVTDVTPIPLYPGAPQAGQDLQLVGYGCFDEWDGTSDGRKRIGPSRVVEVQDDRFSLFLQPELARICPGDSGGPSLSSVNGYEYVVGVHSHKKHALDWEARLDSSYDWIFSEISRSTTIKVSDRPTIQSTEWVASEKSLYVTLERPSPGVLVQWSIDGGRYIWPFWDQIDGKTLRVKMEEELMGESEVSLRVMNFHRIGESRSIVISPDQGSKTDDLGASDEEIASCNAGGPSSGYALLCIGVLFILARPGRRAN